MANVAWTIHRFQGFELDERLFELRCDSEVIATPTRVFSMIAYLLRHRDRVVGKHELIREVWKAKVASDTAISQVVMLARKALRDEGESHRIIKTVRGRGFRFIADVELVEAAAEPATTPETALVPASPNPKPTVDLIGRADEMGALLEAVTALAQGAGRLVLVEGEPGIGKTTLAMALAREAAARHIDVYWGRAWDGGGAPPCWPFVQVLRGMAQREGLGVVRRCIGHGGNELLSLLPEWANGEVVGRFDPGSAAARFRLFDSISRFLRNACVPVPDATASARAPRQCVIILDDLHAADDASIELVHFLASELADTPLLLVATLRDFELSANTKLARLADAVDARQRIRLTGLSGEDLSTLVTQRFGQRANTNVLHTLGEISGGNPLLLGEMCRHIGPGGLEVFLDPSTLTTMSLPERVASAVDKHVSELPAATTEALSIAAVLGREFSMQHLASLCSITEIELVQRLVPAMSRGLLRTSSAGEQRTFSHALVRSAIYTDLPEPTRMALHQRVAETLEQQSQADHPRRLPLFEIAFHYHQAAALGCRPKAIDYARRAAQHAAEMTAFEVAAGHYDRAIHLVEAEHSDAATMHDLLCSAGEAWLKAGQLGLARARFDRAVEDARAENHAERLVRALLCSCSASRGHVFHDRARHDELLHVLSILPEADSEIRARVLAATAMCMRDGEQVSSHDSVTQAAVEVAQRLGSDAALLRTLSIRHLALWGVVHPRILLEISDKIVELERKSKIRDHLLDALLLRISRRAELGVRPDCGAISST